MIANELPKLLAELPLESTSDLPLAWASPPEWAGAASKDLLALLADHAHCEMKAAATGFRLLGSYTEYEALTDAMLQLVREEMRHFERARELLEEQGGRLGKARPDRYVKALISAMRRLPPSGNELLDKLLICAMVEARSCERFRALAACESLETKLRAFFAELALAEARHYEVFVELAEGLSVPRERVHERLKALSAAEAELIAGLPAEPAIH